MFPALLENDVPFHIHEVREYWNDVGLARASCARAPSTRCAGELRLQVEGEELAPGVIVAGEQRRCPTSVEVEGPVWIGRDVRSARVCA